MSGTDMVAPDLAGGGPREPMSAEQIRDYLGTRANHPHASKLLGFKLLDFSIEERWLEAEFHPTQQLANLRNSVQGGIVTAMLDEVMSLAVLVAERFTCGVPTLEIKTSFFNPLPVEPCRARGQALRIGGRVAFMEGTIWTPGGRGCRQGILDLPGSPRQTEGVTARQASPSRGVTFIGRAVTQIRGRSPSVLVTSRRSTWLSSWKTTPESASRTALATLSTSCVGQPAVRSISMATS